MSAIKSLYRGMGIAGVLAVALFAISGCAGVAGRGVATSATGKACERADQAEIALRSDTQQLALLQAALPDKQQELVRLQSEIDSLKIVVKRVEYEAEERQRASADSDAGSDSEFADDQDQDATESVGDDSGDIAPEAGEPVEGETASEITPEGDSDNQNQTEQNEAIDNEESASEPSSEEQAEPVPQEE